MKERLPTIILAAAFPAGLSSFLRSVVCADQNCQPRAAAICAAGMA